MKHPGELNAANHPEGIKNALDPAYVRKFPLTESQVQEVRARGGIVDDVSYGQTVIYPDGTENNHGTTDGLGHEMTEEE